MKKLFFILLLLGILGTVSVNAQYRVFDSGQVGTSPVSGYYLKTDGKNSTWAAVTGGGGSGGGTFSTSTAWGSILYNYPNNASDVVLFGYDGSGVATSSNEAEFSFDPTAKLGLFLNSTKVGIGTSSPFTALGVAGTITANNVNATSTTATSTFAGGVQVGGSSGVYLLNNGKIGIGGSPGNYVLDLVSGANGLNIASGMAYRVGGVWGFGILSGTYYFGGSSTGDASFGANANNQMTIKNGGNIGIGTVSPVTKLEINSLGSSPSSSLYSSGDTLTITGNTDTAAGFNIISGGSNAFNRGVFKATRFRGTAASPTTIASGDYTFSLLGAGYDGTNNLASAGINILVDSTVSTGVMPQAITFESGTSGTRTERMRITSGGLVGIATTTPWKTLSVTGTMAVDGLTTSTAGNAVCILTNKEIVTAGNTTCTTSSGKTKTNIESITSNEAERVITSLRPTVYKNIEGGEVRYGFIAEEVAKIDPKLIEYAKEDTKFSFGVTINKGEPISFDYTRYSGILTKFVQDLYVSVNKLIARVSGLETKLEKQQSEIDLLKKQVEDLQTNIRNIKNI